MTIKKATTQNIITPAQIDWQTDNNGYTVPYSRQFSDVYYSLVNGLAESRYVFIEQNNLPKRFAEMSAFDTLTIGELGFGTGLNFFATWELWKKIREDHQHHEDHNKKIATKHLHFISFEKYPLSKADFEKSLQSWMQTEPQLAPLMKQMIANYPTLVAGCHRLHFYQDNLTLDLWFGDANDNLAKLSTTDSPTNGKHKINAWFLDGFAPSCNESLWAEQIFRQMARLSTIGSTVATFSCAGVVKRGLTAVGFDIAKVKGFAHKREMLTATFTQGKEENSLTPRGRVREGECKLNKSYDNKPITIIGAGVSGLMSAWSLANRGLTVTLLDKTAPLAGASGNPRGLLSPKMTPLPHVDEHLHSIGYLYSSRLFRQMNEVDYIGLTQNLDNSSIFIPSPNPSQREGSSLPLRGRAREGVSELRKSYYTNSKQVLETAVLETQVLETTGAIDLLIKSNIDTDKIRAYPQDFASVLSDSQAKQLSGLHQQALTDNQYLPQAGLVNPQALANVVLAHPLVNFAQADVIKLDEQPQQLLLTTADGQQLATEHAIICCAYESCQLDKRIFDFRKIRGQLSWFSPTEQQAKQLPKLPLKYGGYCASFLPVADDDKHNAVTIGKPHFLLGASFVRNDTDLQIRQQEHQQNLDKLLTAIPELQRSNEHRVNKNNADTESLQDMDGLQDTNSWQNIENWQGRVGIRSQTPDYHPLVGQLAGSDRLWTLSGMGSKGYAYAPICAEVLADQIMGQIPPVSISMLNKLSPNRKRLQQPLK